MAIGVDTSKWKPRKITGTPAAKFRNRLSAGILGFGVLWGAFFQFSSFTEPMKKAYEVLYEDPIEEVERKILIASGLPVRSGEQIRKFMEEEQRLDLPDNKYKVVSKYFANKTVMDESVTEFKEKKSFKVTKKAPAKPKVKKVKQVKGQKDIRTVLKGKKNELIAYTEDFDSICKKSGIDVDAEQLQLAIALSKSLETPEPADSTSSSSKALTTQQRTGLIRTTLKEYGFKVPQKPGANRKTKKRRKPYKLLLTSAEEKQQIITDRYSQVLFELNSLKTTTSDSDLVLSNLFIYTMSTNIEYEHIKDDSIFYVENLLEETPNNMGCLLKNWSDIPGRPSSPDRDKSELLFSDIECSQDELDIVLSGPLKYSNNILRKKGRKDEEESIDLSPVKRNMNKTLIEHSPDLIEDVDIHSSPVLVTVSSGDDMSDNGKHKELCTVVIDEEEKQILNVKQPSRSLSPDLFDDDDTLVEIPNETLTETVINPANNVTKEVSEVMDITECVNNVLQKPVAQLSQQNNVTKRKSNDFMEITECVASSSKQILKIIDEHIDLTGNLETPVTAEENSVCGENGEMVQCVHGSSQPIPKRVEHIDLTANYVATGDDKSCEDVEITGTTGIFLIDGIVKTDEHIDLTGHCQNDMEPEKNSVNADNIEHMDLTQSSNSSGDSLPFVHIGGTQSVSLKSVDDTILLNEDDYLHESPDVNIEINDADNKQQNQSVKSDINTEGEDPIETDEISIINIDESIETPRVDDDNVHLTPASDTNEALDNISNNNSQHINNSNLGKKDDVSVDYDEALENMNFFPYYTYDENYSDTGLTEDHLQKTSDKDLISSSKREILELSDDENCPNKDVENLFDLGGISVIDHLPSFRKSRNTMSSIPNGSMRDSLPMVNVKGNSDGKPKSTLTNLTNENSSNTRPQTPQTKVNKHLNIETPEQSEYIVKTDNVTPMLDYSSMSTPERNRELDKYGLKPFKRKRAIQLLTHLYNQTHPYVESTEELTSPSKKQRTENFSQPSSSISSIRGISPRKRSRSPLSQSQRTILKSPRKALQSPRKFSRSPRNSPGDLRNLSDSDKENELFLVTTEVPVIRNVECDADDWVFQKREKAKLHSCRVPLHIAFHNYVSCRRRLQEAILRYEPINIDVIHKQLAASGHRYDPKDLLKFLDKKCITVKTADYTKSNKRY